MITLLNMINNCKLLKLENPSENDINLDNFELLKTYVKESHLWRYLLRCKDCGQLYFYEFYEEIDWDKGRDPQYVTYIPVENTDKADEYSKLDQFGILKEKPRLQKDWSSDQDKPKIFWIK